MQADIATDVATIGRIGVVETALEVLRKTTGLRIARERLANWSTGR